MRIGIVGAGVAGLTTAKVLTQAGHEVEVFDKAPDVGGVWSRTRRYPGLTTQSPKAQYSFSDHPMPEDFPEWPTGAQVQEYLGSYVAAKGLEPHCGSRPPSRARRRCPTVAGGSRSSPERARPTSPTTTGWWWPTGSSASPRCRPTTAPRSSGPPAAG